MECVAEEPQAWAEFFRTDGTEIKVRLHLGILRGRNASRRTPRYLDTRPQIGRRKVVQQSRPISSNRLRHTHMFTCIIHSGVERRENTLSVWAKVYFQYFLNFVLLRIGVMWLWCLQLGDEVFFEDELTKLLTSGRVVGIQPLVGAGPEGEDICMIEIDYGGPWAG